MIYGIPRVHGPRWRFAYEFNTTDAVTNENQQRIASWMAIDSLFQENYTLFYFLHAISCIERTT